MKKINLTRDVKIVFETLEKAGFECYMVGGCVRDFLLGKKPHDIDFTTNAMPNEIKKCFDGFSVIDTGIKHGTLTVLVNHIPYEITTFREDGEYLNNRKPKGVRFVRDLKTDLSRRDFTINAIAYNPSVGFVDYFGGQRDLKNKIIRCVGEPSKRLEEDALRILRALRFSSTMGFEIEEKTKQACCEKAHLLKNISAERVCGELFKTLLGDNAHNIIFDYIDVWGSIIPEMLAMKGFLQYNPHHVHDVLKHTCVALQGAPNDLIVRLAVLFHDIGKPESFTMDEKGNGHFYGHAAKSENITRTIFHKLKVDNKTKDDVLTLIKYHDLDLQATEKYVKKLCYKLGSLEMVKKLILVQRADNYGQALLHGERISKFDEIDKIIEKIEKEDLSFSLKDLEVDGNDLIKMGYKGKDIGVKLNFLLDAVLNDKIKNNKKDLVEYLTALK